MSHSNVHLMTSMVLASTNEIDNRSYLEALVGLGQCTTSTTSLREGYNQPNDTVLQVQKANGRGVLGDTMNLRFYAGAKCVTNHGIGSRGGKDVSGAFQNLRNQLEF